MTRQLKVSLDATRSLTKIDLDSCREDKGLNDDNDNDDDDDDDHNEDEAALDDTDEESDYGISFYLNLLMNLSPSMEQVYSQIMKDAEATARIDAEDRSMPYTAQPLQLSMVAEGKRPLGRSYSTSPSTLTDRTVCKNPFRVASNKASFVAKLAAPSRRAAPHPGFVAKVEEIRPDFQKDDPHGLFNPPDRRNAYETRSASLFRYKGGVFEEIVQNDSIHKFQLTQIYDAATIFSQAFDTDHLLTVPFDARTRNVSETQHDWRCLGFDYQPAPSGGTYALLAFIGAEECLPADVPGWENLIPKPYRYQKTSESSKTTCAGLIGKLPLLVALAAFSACSDQLIASLTTTISPARKWLSHDWPTGRQYLLT